MKVRLVVDEYSGKFQRANSIGRWRTVGTIGNAGIALDFVEILRKLDIEVVVFENIMEATE